jgi:pantetheine-phosphate adenylyltransferase
MADAPRLAVCPGSFDPLTNGHVEMIVRGARLFDRLVVAVLSNAAKQPWFPLDERLVMVREVLRARAETRHAEVEAFDGLLADYVRAKRAAAVIRGLRTASEFADESQMAMMNRHLFEGFETVFLVATPDVAFISSRLVRDIAALGGPLDGLVPPLVAGHLARRQSRDRTVRA